MGTTEEENNSKVADRSNCSYVAAQTRPQYFRTDEIEMLKTINIESLPDDIIIEILVRVPAQNICNAARLVSPKWYQMIRTHDFVRAHLQQSTPGLLIQNKGYNRDEPIFVATQKGRIEISNFDYKFTREVLSSCNGLILERLDKKRNDLYIANHAIKQHIALPTMKTMTPYNWSAIAYAAAAMEYKVICTFNGVCAILTVGVDKDWTRRVSTQHLTRTTEELLRQCPLTTEGFVHWARNDSHSEYVLSLNVETEIIKQFHVPHLRRHDGETKLLYNYLSMGSYLSLLIGRSEFSREVWEMKPETGEWTKVASIDLEAQKWTFEGVSALNCRLVPVGWSKLGEVLFFRVRKSWPDHNYLSSPTHFCIAYNVHTHEVDSFELEYYGSSCHIVYRNSLAWLDVC